MTAISVSERLLEMAAFYTWLDFTLTVFLGIDGVDLEQGFWYDNILIGNVERSMTHAARQVFILADSTKMGHTSIVPMLPLEAADYIITNPFYDTRFIQRLKRHGCDVIFSEEPEDY